MRTLARFSMRHARLVLSAWAAALALGLGLAGGVGNHFVNDLLLPGTDSQRTADLLHATFPSRAGDTDQIVFRASPGGTLDDAATRRTIAGMLQRVAALPHVTAVASPYAQPRTQISRDRSIGFAAVGFDDPGDALSTAAIRRVIDTAQAIASPRLQVELGGDAIEQTQRPTLGAATAIGIAAAVVVLLVTFGSLLAMALPIVTALCGLGISMGSIAVLTHVLDTPDFASELALLIGLGVGVDYSLFVVTRFREAYANTGGDVADAVEVAMGTAGRSVAFAGTCVVIAMLGLLTAGIHLFYGVAVATSLTVLAVLAAALTLLPALLARLGHRIGAPRRRRRRTAGAGVWPRWVGLIQRRPALAALAATGLMLALAAPALGLRLAASDAGTDQPHTTTRRAYDLLARGFGAGWNGPLLVAVHLPAGAGPRVLDRLDAALAATSGVASVAPPKLGPTRTVAAVTVYPRTPPQSAATYSLVHRLRDAVVPPIARATGATVYVGGFTASQMDFAHVLAGGLPLFLGVVIALSTVLLLVVFRSVVIPLQAAAMNLLSIGAALGVVQAVFERGWLDGPLGVQRSPIEAFIPVVVFAIVFGLSMDYEVFLVSRVREAWQDTGDASAAVRTGLVGTGGVITAAAAVMVVVFASFALAGEHVLRLFGLALATAVLLDAVVIRTILLPALLEVSGRATWAFPDWLDRRLPAVAIEAPERPRPTPVPDTD